MYDSLTAREKEVYNLMMEGLTDAEIAEKLIIEVSTVASHKNRVYQKFVYSGRHRRLKLIIEYYKNMREVMEVNLEELKKLVSEEEQRYETKINELENKLNNIKQKCLDMIHIIHSRTEDALIDEILKIIGDENDKTRKK